jgi:hypothetical protein
LQANHSGQTLRSPHVDLFELDGVGTDDPRRVGEESTSFWGGVSNVLAQLLFNVPRGWGGIYVSGCGFCFLSSGQPIVFVVLVNLVI